MMSVAKPSTCLFCTFKQTVRRQVRPATTRRFHISPIRSQDKPRPKPTGEDFHTVNDIKQLSDAEISQNYTPEQAAAIKATQEHLSFDQKYQKTTQPNVKPWTMHYVQNMTEIDPVYDKPVRQPWTNLDDNSRLKTEDELNEDIVNFMHNMPQNEGQAAEAFEHFLAHNRITVGKESAELAPRSATAPDIPTMRKQDMLPDDKNAEASSERKGKKGRDAEAGDQEISPALVRLLQMTGLSQSELRKLRVKSIISHRVVNQTRLGKIQKQYWLSIAGNQNGLLGIGEGKSEESAEGMIQSQYRAIRNMVPVMRYENRTIFGDIKGKVGATELELFARPPGFGLRCQHLIFEMCRCAGIVDLAARVTRARNPMNTVKAAFQALQRQKDPEEIAKGRGKKLVDVRKVYYAGNV